jgi:hypothetical protein
MSDKSPPGGITPADLADRLTVIAARLHALARTVQGAHWPPVDAITIGDLLPSVPEQKGASSPGPASPK